MPPRLVRTFLLITARAGDSVGVMQNADTFTSHNALITLFVRSSNEVHITFAYFAIVFLKKYFSLTDTEEFLWREKRLNL